MLLMNLVNATQLIMKAHCYKKIGEIVAAAVGCFRCCVVG